MSTPAKEAFFRASEGQAVIDMTEAHRTKEELAELVDDRLAPDVRAAVEAHLSVCAACRSEFEVQRTSKSFAARHFAPGTVPLLVRERVTQGLRQEAEATATSFTRRWWLAAAGIAAAALLTIMFVLRPHRELVADVAESFRQFLSGDLQLEFTTHDPAALERWFRDSGIAFETRVFDLGMMQYQLVGGRAHQAGEHRSGFFVYRGPHNEILICQMYPGSVNELPAPLAMRAHDGIQFHVHQRAGVTLVFWQEGEIVCVLASDADSESVIQLAFAKAVKAEESPR